MRVLALSSAACGTAAARPLPQRSGARRSHSAVAQPSGFGRSQLRAEARVCRPVAAATSGNGIGSWDAAKAARQALLHLLAATSSGNGIGSWAAIKEAQQEL